MAHADHTIARMERDRRYRTALKFLHHNVIVRASQTRSPTTALNYPGRVVAVAWGLEGSNDVLVMVLTGPTGVGMPMAAFELTRILTITMMGEGY